MSMQDPLADMLAIIKNGQSAKKTMVVLPSSKFKVNVAKVLEDEGYVGSVSVETTGKKSLLTIHLKYHNDKPVIESLKRVSSPGLRVYKQASDLPRVMGGLGVAIISTSNGLMSDRKARAAGQGGEVVCVVS